MTASAALLRQRDAITLVDERQPLLRLELPIRLENVANEHTHWRVRQKRAKAQRGAVAMVMRVELALRRRGLTTRGGLVVVITRIAPRTLDDDGAVAAAKTVRDGIADALGIDDRDERVVWLVDQDRGPPKTYACRVEVYA